MCANFAVQFLQNRAEVCGRTRTVEGKMFSPSQDLNKNLIIFDSLIA